MTIRQTLARTFRRIYVRPPEPIPPEHQRLLWLVGAGTVIANYDVSLYGMALLQIQTTFGIAENAIADVNALFRLGVLPALFLAYLADVIGRRTLLLVTLAGASVATVWTSFAQTTEEFIIAQLLARAFIYTEELLCIVVIAEEFNERVRGWGIGALGAMGALGAGLAAMIFASVNLLPYGWRALYFLGAIPLLYLLWLRRRLPETKRFESNEHKREFLRPMLALFANYPGRMALLVAMAIPAAFASANIVTFQSKFLQNQHGWHPAQVSTMVVIGGIIAILGATTAGTLSDRFGRRAVLSAAILAFVVCFGSFYGLASGPILIPIWIAGIFAFLMCDVLIGALSAELFPTSHRTLASAVRYFFWIMAGSLALYLEGPVYDLFGSHGTAVALLILPAPLALIPIWFLPEPAKKPLEEVAAERAP
jgi:putative MFS transporter